MGNSFYLETNDDRKKLIIKDISVSIEDVNRGNPYNSIAVVEVVSGSFSGKCEIDFNFHSLKNFVSQLGMMYQTLSGKADLKDISRNSHITLEIDKKGVVGVSGLLVEGSNEQSLTFLFYTDQTAIKNLWNKLSIWIDENINGQLK